MRFILIKVRVRVYVVRTNEEAFEEEDFSQEPIESVEHDTDAGISKQVVNWNAHVRVWGIQARQIDRLKDNRRTEDGYHWDLQRGNGNFVTNFDSKVG